EMVKPLLTEDQVPPSPRQAKSQGQSSPCSQSFGPDGNFVCFRNRKGVETVATGNGRGSVMIRWWRLRDWQVARVWQKVWKELLDESGLADKIDWSKAVVDSSSVRALFVGRKLAPIPPIAAKTV
ncbi:MAG: hypothetical protein ACKO26_12750, partial [Planctomycetota bacterium]